MNQSCVVVGIAQQGAKPANDQEWLCEDPVNFMARMAHLALADTGQPGLITEIDAFAAVDPVTWGYEDVTAETAAAIGLPEHCDKRWIPAGGNSPQYYLHGFVEDILSGKIKSALICGAETLYSLKRSMLEGKPPDWPAIPNGHDPLRGQRTITTPLEAKHGLQLPTHCFALFENALSVSRGNSPEQQLKLSAALLAKNSQAAARNPNAWFRHSYKSDEILQPADDNRLVVHPYTKRMCAIMEVDQAAALVLMSQSEAERRGLMDKAVSILGGASAEDAWTPIEKPDFSSSPGMQAASHTALSHAGLQVTDIDGFDFYSCFPCVIQMALDNLGIDNDDPRPFSLTGGLAYAGGPGNAYTLMSVATAVEQCRRHASTYMVTGLGMAAAKHVATILSSRPEHIASASFGCSRNAGFNRTESPQTTEQANGNATIETWTVAYKRDGSVDKCILMLRLDDGSRTIANGGENEAALADLLLENNPIGKSGQVSFDGKRSINVFTLDKGNQS